MLKNGQIIIVDYDPDCPEHGEIVAEELLSFKREEEAYEQRMDDARRWERENSTT